MAIADWPISERPRERLLRFGAKHLSDTELLAIFLRTGIRGRSALDLARELLTTFGSLTALLSASPSSLLESPGMGEAKIAQLLAVQELTRRTLGEQLATGTVLTSPRAVGDYLRLTLVGLNHEVFCIVLMDAQHRVITCEELFRGTLTQTSVYPREVVKCALHHNAASVILAHNHPSGIAEPSQADEILTRSLCSALALVDIQVLDHFVVATDRIVSFAERGLL